MNSETQATYLENCPTSALIAAARRHIKHAIDELCEPYELNPYHYWILWILREGPLSLTELASLMWLDHPTTSRLVHSLEQSGLLQITPDPNHGRRIRIQIAPQQEARVQGICASAGDYQAQFEAGFTPEEIKALRTGLSKVIVNLQRFLKTPVAGKPKKRHRSHDDL